MKKVALVFVVAVFVPSLVLAWLAVRSLRDQQFLLERQQSLLYQGVADGLAKDVADVIAEEQRVLVSKVMAMLREHNALELATIFDDELRRQWPLAQVGFVVTLPGKILSPSPFGRPEARVFCTDNSRFLANRESAEVYLNPKQVLNNSLMPQTESQQAASDVALENKKYGSKLAQARNVVPQSQTRNQNQLASGDETLSKVAPSEAEFRQLIGDDTEGTIARFVDNKLNLLLWFRPAAADDEKGAKKGVAQDQLVFGAQISLARLIDELRPKMQVAEPALRHDICAALLDDTAKPVLVSHQQFNTDWKHPFVATEIGEVLPHWEVAVYLLNPLKLKQSAQTLRLILGLLIAVLLSSIGIGSWLIVTDLNRQLTLVRQKQDFVSNVSTS